jgi:hypothetical protein
MNQHPHSEPRHTKRSPAPLVHAASPEEWITYKRNWLYFVGCYREAADRLKKGGPHGPLFRRINPSPAAVVQDSWPAATGARLENFDFHVEFQGGRHRRSR